jgi:hypothetical protein
MLHPNNAARHEPHALLSSLGSEFSVNADHAHLSNGSFAHWRNEFATAVLPPAETALAQLYVGAVVVAVTTRLASLVAAAGRGPPSALASGLTGQDILTLNCTARR